MISDRTIVVMYRLFYRAGICKDRRKKDRLGACKGCGHKTPSSNKMKEVNMKHGKKLSNSKAYKMTPGVMCIVDMWDQDARKNGRDKGG